MSDESFPGLPTTLEVAQLLGGLINKVVDAHLVKSDPNGVTNGGCFVGVYDDGASAIEAVWRSNWPASASLGAALTLLARNQAELAVKDKTMPQEMLENLREVVNVSASVFKVKRVRLTRLYAPSEPLPANVSAFLAGNVRGMQLKIEVRSFLVGAMELFVRDTERHVP